MISDLIFLLSLVILAFIFKKITQKYSWILPISIIAGLLGILLGHQGFGLYKLRLSSQIYLDVFLATIFATFPLTINNLGMSYIKKVNSLWRFSILQYFLQWGLSIIITAVVLSNLWPEVTENFAVAMPGGFVGGYGSAAVLGSIFEKLGDDTVQSLTMAMATVGTFTSIIGGMLWVLWGRNKGLFSTNKTIKTLVPKKPSLEIKSTLLIVIIVTIAYFIKPLITHQLNFQFPLFILSVVLSFLVRVFTKDKIKLNNMSLGFISNKATDLLVILGIISIKFTVIYEFIIPLFIMAIIGISLCMFNFLYLAPKFFQEHVYEKGLFTWGWSSGGLVYGLALVNIVTTEEDNVTLMQKFAMTYLLVAPIEMSLILSMPYLCFHGYAQIAAILLILLAILILKTIPKRTDK